MRKQLDKVYDPAQVEDRTYQYWEEGGFFGAQPDENKTPYTIVIPPPNITGQLHMGHALDETLQDILIRFRRMQGFAALWVPGTDHASIATEAKIVEAMRKEGLSKEDLGRDGFLERAWNWKKQYGGRIVEQLKKLGFVFGDSKANFIFASHKEVPAEELFRALREADIYVRHWNKPRISNSLRISVGTDEEMDRLIAFLKEYLEKRV